MEKKRQDANSGESDPVNNWFEELSWAQGWKVAPHQSVNREKLFDQFTRFPERWEAAFRLLQSGVFMNSEPGKHQVDGDNLFYVINQYVTNDPESVLFEAHHTYADIQYVFEGEERMATSFAEYPKVKVPYDAGKDILFYDEPEDAVYHVAASAEFLVFFPGELHKPGVHNGIKMPVKKVVVKVKCTP